MANPMANSRSIEGTTIPLAPHVTGATYPATEMGFVQALAEANIATRAGWRVQSVVKLERTLAVLFSRVGGPSAPTQFFEEEDDGP